MALSCGCSADGVVTLGRALPDPQFGDGGRAVANINDAAADQEPTLTGDLLEVYFTSHRPGPGQGDIWRARRGAREDAFEAPALVSELSTEASERSPAISRDGLTLWLASDRPGGQGGLDIWQTERASRDADWGAPHPLDELNSASDDLPRPPAQAERVLPLVSLRDGVLQIYLATRSSRVAAFESVEPVGLPLESGLGGAFLSEDGRLLFFHGEADGELYLAWRRSLAEPFREPLALEAVNSSARERDPFVSGDQTRFFFASDRQGGFDIFATTLDLPVFE